MKISISVQDGIYVGTAWCDIDKGHEGLSQAELLERYIAPSFAAALDRLKTRALDAASKGIIAQSITESGE
jgi:hypothetical protein